MTDQEENNMVCTECNHPQSEHSEHDDWVCTHDWQVDVEGCQCLSYMVEEENE